MGSHRSRVAIALAVVYLVWGSTYLGIRVVVEQVPPLAGMGLRFTVAGLVLGLVIGARKGFASLRLTRAQLVSTVLLGLLLPALGNGLVAVAEALGATSGYTALLVATVPFVVIIFRLIDRDRPRAMTVLGVLAGFVGLAVLVTEGRTGPSAIALGPALLVVLAATFWAFGSYLQPRLTLPDDVFVTTAYEMLFGGLIMGLASVPMGERLTFDYSMRTWAGLAYLIAFGSILAYTAFVWLVGNAPLSLVSTYAYVNPLIAVVLGWQLLGEPLTGAILAGGAVVIGSVAVVVTSERRRIPPRDQS